MVDCFTSLFWSCAFDLGLMMVLRRLNSAFSAFSFVLEGTDSFSDSFELSPELWVINLYLFII